MRLFLLTMAGLVIVSSLKAQDDIPYISAKLSPYSEESGLVSDPSLTAEKYTWIETGWGDSLRVYLGTCAQNGNTFYWARFDRPAESQFQLHDLSKNTTSDICKVTLSCEFRSDNKKVSFDFIHNLLTDEIEYIWLDQNDGIKSQKAIFGDLNDPFQKGKMFPELTVETLDGEDLSINDFAGKTIVIN